MRPAQAGAACTITIDLAALARTGAGSPRMASPAECAAVVKADAYGIGIERAVPALAAAGCRTFFVALPDEGRRVRAAAPDAVDLRAQRLPAGAAAPYRARQASARARTMTKSLGMGGSAAAAMPSALHVDTGMNRLGFPIAEVHRPRPRSPMLAAAGPALLMSHLACADEPDHPINARQIAGVLATCGAAIRHCRRRSPIRRASCLDRTHHFDLVRAGHCALRRACGGGEPDAVVSAQARVLQVREAAAGETVGYGAGRTLTRATRIAILAAGYADGYLRAAGSSDRRSRSFRPSRRPPLPLVGRVSMDLMAVDVTDCPEPVQPRRCRRALRRRTFRSRRSPRAAGTIPYELLTNLSRRAERIYLAAESAS